MKTKYKLGWGIIGLLFLATGYAVFITAFDGSSPCDGTATVCGNFDTFKTDCENQAGCNYPEGCVGDLDESSCEALDSASFCDGEMNEECDTQSTEGDCLDYKGGGICIWDGTCHDIGCDFVDNEPTCSFATGCDWTNEVCDFVIPFNEYCTFDGINCLWDGSSQCPDLSGGACAEAGDFGCSLYLGCDGTATACDDLLTQGACGIDTTSGTAGDNPQFGCWWNPDTCSLSGSAVNHFVNCSEMCKWEIDFSDDEGNLTLMGNGTVIIEGANMTFNYIKKDNDCYIAQLNGAVLFGVAN